MGEKEGLAVVADAAFNNGQEYGPPWKWQIELMHDPFVTQMEATREEVVKYLMGNRVISDSQKNLTGP
jgi:hypothetical protein